jgi:hypothetical protein
MAGSSDTEPSQHFELLPTFRSALACKDFTTNNSETLRQIILKATVLKDAVGEMYFCNLRCFCVWSVQLATRPNLSVEDKTGAYSLTTPSGESRQRESILNGSRVQFTLRRTRLFRRLRPARSPRPHGKCGDPSCSSFQGPPHLFHDGARSQSLGHQSLPV